MDILLKVRLDSGKAKSTPVTQNTDGSYHASGYGRTETLEGLLIRIVNRHLNTPLTVNFEIGDFTLSLIYESSDDTVLCGFTFALMHGFDQIASLEGEHIHWRFAFRDIKAMAQRWFKWASYSFLTKSEKSPYLMECSLIWKNIMDIESWKHWVWESAQRGGLAHRHSLEDAWKRESTILIPKLEAVIMEVKNGLAKTA